MKFVLAPDSFKGTMSAARVASIMADAVHAVFPDAQCLEIPMADGGEGTTQSLVDALAGELRTAAVTDALGHSREAHFGWIPAERLAVVEIAQAAGIEHIAAADRDPRSATTRGVGQLLTHILDLEPARIIVGLGGSATNDGGWGMARELGVRVFDSQGESLADRPLELARAQRLDVSGLDPRWAAVEITLACDVNNPLTGPNGASAVFGPQKGLSETDVSIFDSALAVWGDLLDSHAQQAGVAHAPTQISKTPGAGAAGGLGAAFMALFGATPRRGVELVIDTVRLGEHLRNAHIVFTGEGSIDFQTKFGKTPWGVMRAAREQGIPTIAFAGNLGHGVEELHDAGFSAIVPTVRKVGTLADALANAEKSLFEAVRMTCRILATSVSESRHLTQQDCKEEKP
ncbi:glycerate kinase [Trueperella bialowiezensis]|uniref:Glycerate kinase n=1 Tax=Trueperella bialowiezensis TaxID=312285 RepID=A0A448PFC8_9ACTO|nr:glycerate kinase [Trueperella bialowiezensis]VEI13626.1 Glycerate kinase [Trueperella bialowiezensis]